MTITMNDTHLGSILEIETFLKGALSLSFEGVSLQEQYAWIGQTLVRFRYFSLKKKEKGIVKAYMMKMTGKSDAQITRCIGRYRSTGKVWCGSRRKHRFSTRYTPEDIALIVKTDNAHSRLSGKATRRIFEREYEVYGKKEYVRLKDISVAHIYNLRTKKQYLSSSHTYTKTQATSTPIGIRRKPDPQGMPGFIRVDSVHQGDSEDGKGVYHINLIDEVLQWEIIGATEKISEAYLQPILEGCFNQFPFTLQNFHSDNGSEYINKIVAKLLNRLLISQTKSRSRRSGDQALVEGKNGSIIRKHMGRIHISQKEAQPINTFYATWMNPYLNFHRPCGFPTSIINRKGKERKVYNVYQTPFERLLSLEKPQLYLKEGVTLNALKVLSLQRSDTEQAMLMQEEKRKLFQLFLKKRPA